MPDLEKIDPKDAHEVIANEKTAANVRVELRDGDSLAKHVARLQHYAVRLKLADIAVQKCIALMRSLQRDNNLELKIQPATWLSTTSRVASCASIALSATWPV